MKMEVMMQFGLVFLFAVVHKAVNGALPERDGGAIHVRTAQELQQAVTKAGAGDTILLEDDAYRLASSLWIESKKHLTLKGASEDEGDADGRWLGWWQARGCYRYPWFGGHHHRAFDDYGSALLWD